MVSAATLLTCIISLLVCLLLPPVILLIYAAKNVGGKIISGWLLGAAGFFVTQILIRVPILSLLQTTSGFIAFSSNHPFLFTLCLSFTAGLFELAGRFVVAKLMQKKLTYQRSFAAGLGHGGIEAMLLVGMTYLNNILYIFMINGGTFDALVAEAANTGVDVSALWQIKESLIHSSPALFLLGGFERILSMSCHVAMSLVVCYSIHQGMPWKGTLVCLAIHTMIDLTAGINLLTGSVLSQAAAYTIIYTILTAAALLSLLIVLKIRRRWREREENNHA